MGVKHLALAMVLVASPVALAEHVVAIELGELQAVPSSHPPYIFRLAIITPPAGFSGSPAVTVRQPHDALSLVKNNRLELRLASLSDVELEVSHGSQTLNRLLPKSELQAARARLGMMTASPHAPLALARDREPLATGVRPLTTVTPSALDRALLERELQAIHAEIQRLVGGVTPWEGFSTASWYTEHGAAALLVMLMLGGAFIAGVAALVTGYLLHRSAVDRQRYLQRALLLSIRRGRGELASGPPRPPTLRRGGIFGDWHERLEPVTMLRRVLVSQRTRRRVRIQASRGMHSVPQAEATPPTQAIARVSPTRSAPPAEFVEALAHLRRELMRLQRRLPCRSLRRQP
jgi:hypothetical protein